MEKKTVYRFKIVKDCACELKTNLDIESHDIDDINDGIEEFAEVVHKDGLKIGDKECQGVLKSWKLLEEPAFERYDEEDDEIGIDISYTIEYPLTAIEIERNESRERLWCLQTTSAEVWNFRDMTTSIFSDYEMIQHTKHFGEPGLQDKIFGVKTEEIDPETMGEILAFLEHSLEWETGQGDYDFDEYSEDEKIVSIEFIGKEEYDKI